MRLEKLNADEGEEKELSHRISSQVNGYSASSGCVAGIRAVGGYVRFDLLGC